MREEILGALLLQVDALALHLVFGLCAHEVREALLLERRDQYLEALLIEEVFAVQAEMYNGIVVQRLSHREWSDAWATHRGAAITTELVEDAGPELLPELTQRSVGEVGE